MIAAASVVDVAAARSGGLASRNCAGSCSELGVAAAVAVLAPRARALVVGPLVAATLLAGPAAYSLQTASTAHTGALVTAGPASTAGSAGRAAWVCLAAPVWDDRLASLAAERPAPAGPARRHRRRDRAERRHPAGHRQRSSHCRRRRRDAGRPRRRRLGQLGVGVRAEVRRLHMVGGDDERQ